MNCEVLIESMPVEELINLLHKLDYNTNIKRVSIVSADSISVLTDEHFVFVCSED